MARRPGGQSVRRILLALGALAALPTCRLAVGQTIAVVTTRSFRPTAVLQPHLRFVVGTDGNDARATFRDVALPPVAFGNIRIDGVQPGAREPEGPPFADTVRFEADGRVILQLADAAGRPPMTAELIGARGAAAGRLVIAAPRFPLGRALLVTVAPADIFDLVGHITGFGVRDRTRIDDRGGMAYVNDTTAGPTTVAIGFGRGTHGRIQGDLTSVVVRRDFGGVTGDERRQVGSLLLAVDPVRDENGTARAEIVFGVGNSEAEAAGAARAASAEPPANPRTPALRIRTASSDLDLLLRHLVTAAGWMLDWDVIGGERTIPASASRPAVRPMDAWLGSPLALQRGDTAATCGSYRYLRRAAGGGPARVEAGIRLGSAGRYLSASDSTDPAADAAMVLLAHACYMASHNAATLRLEWPALVAAATRAAAGGTGEIGAEAVARLGDLDDELSRLAGAGQRLSSGDSLRAEAVRLAGQGTTPGWQALWRTASGEAQRGVNRDYGRLSAGGEEGGLSFAAAGGLLDLVVGELFGVTEYLDRLEIAPVVDSIAALQPWQLDGWLLSGGDTLGMTYRPAERSAAIRLTAVNRRRLVVRFPWLTAGSCVTVRRGADAPEPATLVQQADGSFYFDVRGADDPADIRVRGAACGG